MTNVGRLNQRLQELVELESSLWRAFRKTEKEFLPPNVHPIRSFSEVISLVRTGLLRRRYQYPLYLLLAVISALAVVAISLWFLLPYMALLGAAMFSRSKFVEAYAKKRLGTTNFSSTAFGIDQPSLVVAGVIKMRETQQVLDASSVQAILKILKASNDYSDVAFGVADAIKKSLFGLPFLLAGWIYSNSALFAKYTTSVGNLIERNLTIAVVLALVVVAFFFFVYDLVLGQTFLKRRKKKYLLILTLIAEGFVAGKR